MPSTEIAIGSLARESRSIAESFATGVEAILMIDISASMGAVDCPGGQTRYAAACDQLRRLQKEIPGKVAIIEWSENHAFCPGGIPSPALGACTDMAKVLRFVKIADGCGIRLILISDGEPDSQADTLQVAGQFQSQIDTIYIGPEGGPGADFLRRLSAMTGGRSSTRSAREILNLADDCKRLLTA